MDTMRREAPEGTSVPPVHIGVNAHREPACGAGVADFHADMAEAPGKPQLGNDGHGAAIADMLGRIGSAAPPHVEYTGDDYTHLTGRKPPQSEAEPGE